MNRNKQKVITEVVNHPVKHYRTAQLTIVDDKVIFDTSSEEYGPYTFDLSVLERKIAKHKLKLGGTIDH